MAMTWLNLAKQYQGEQLKQLPLLKTPLHKFAYCLEGLGTIEAANDKKQVMW